MGHAFGTGTCMTSDISWLYHSAMSCVSNGLETHGRVTPVVILVVKETTRGGAGGAAPPPRGRVSSLAVSLPASLGRLYTTRLRGWAGGLATERLGVPHPRVSRTV